MPQSINRSAKLRHVWRPMRQRQNLCGYVMRSLAHSYGVRVMTCFLSAGARASPQSRASPCSVQRQCGPPQLRLVSDVFLILKISRWNASFRGRLLYLPYDVRLPALAIAGRTDIHAPVESDFLKTLGLKYRGLCLLLVAGVHGSRGALIRAQKVL